LGAKTDTFKVCGFHTTLYPVELPSWLPKEVVKHMVDVYGKYLRKELHFFITRHSIQSQSKTPLKQSRVSVDEEFLGLSDSEEEFFGLSDSEEEFLGLSDSEEEGGESDSDNE
jgi:hypothetical protein